MSSVEDTSMDDTTAAKIKQLKLQALTFKREGKIAEAKSKLAEANLLEYSSIKYQEVEDVNVLKKVAWSLKTQKKHSEYEACVSKIKSLLEQTPPVNLSEASSISQQNEKLIKEDSSKPTNTNTTRSNLVNQNKSYATPSAELDRQELQSTPVTTCAQIEKFGTTPQRTEKNLISDENESIDSDKSETEDKELLKEYEALLLSDEEAEKEDFGEEVERAQETSIRITADNVHADMESLDDNDMLDYESLIEIEALPSSEKYQERIAYHKNEAIRKKKAGNIEGAKESLRMSKALHSVWQKSYGIEETNETSEEIIVSQEDFNSKLDHFKPKKICAEDLKQQAIQFKLDGKLKEAAESYRQYKVAKEREEKAESEKKAREVKARKRLVVQQLLSDIQKEASSADSQIREFQFLALLGVDSEAEYAKTQIDLWKSYRKECLYYISNARLKDIDEFPDILNRKECALRELAEGAGCRVNPSQFKENEIKLAFLCLSDLNKNTEINRSSDFPKDSPIRIEYSLASLQDENEACIEGNTKAEMPPYVYNYIASISVSRSPKALRKLIRRKLDVRVYQCKLREDKKKSQGFSILWGSSKSSKEEVETKFIGRVSIPLKDFYTDSVIGGKLPLMNKSNTRAIGGDLYLSLNARSAFGENSNNENASILNPAPFKKIILD